TSSGYGVLNLVPLWSLVKCRHKYAVSSLMDMAYRMVLAGKIKSAIFADQPRGTYTNTEIDEMLASKDKIVEEAKEKAKRQRRELELLGRVDSEICGGSGSESDGGGMISRAGMRRFRTCYIW
nr:hypothetical protein [Tanacetum cinerariifolium]